MGAGRNSGPASRQSRLAKAMGLTWSDRVLLAEAMAALALIRAGLIVVSFRRLEQFVGRTAGRRRRSVGTADRIAWAIRVGNRFVPWGTCLSESLASQILLSRRGLPYRLTLGVRRGEGNRFQAHAWIESNGQIVCGGEQAEGFVPLTIFEGGEA